MPSGVVCSGNRPGRNSYAESDCRGHGGSRRRARSVQKLDNNNNIRRLVTHEEHTSNHGKQTSNTNELDITKSLNLDLLPLLFCA